MFEEFPKCLYFGGDVEADFRLVTDADAEVAERADGYLSANEAAARTPRAYVRKPKAV